MIQKFRKKSAIIEAIRYTGNNGLEIEKWSNNMVLQSPVIEQSEDNPTGAYVQIKTIDTKDSWAIAIVGDWVVKGIKGEFYPCKNDIFMELHERVIEESTEEEPDSMLPECIEFARSQRKITRSMLQRKFRLGYIRAGRIMMQIELSGILDLKHIGNPDKERKVIA